MADTELPNNVIPGEAQEVARPAWVPPNAHWVNGLWYANGRPIFMGEVPVPAEVVRARYIEEDNARLAKAHAGLPAGYYRQGGLIYNPQKKVAVELPGGYIDDGSHLPGHAEDRAARIADINEARAVELQAIADLEAAQLRRDEAAARRFQSHNKVVD